MLWYSRVLGQDPLCPTPLPTWHPCSGCSGSESTSTVKESRCHVTKQHDCAKGWQRNSPGLHQTAVLVCKSSDTALFPRSKHRALEAGPGSQASKHPATGWMGPLPCKNTWQPLASYSRVTRKKGDSTWLWWLLQLLWSYKIFQHFHEMVRKEEYEYSQVIQQWRPKLFAVLPQKSTTKAFCPCPLCLLTQPAVQIWKEFAASFLFQTLSPHVGYWASSGSGFTDTWLLRISKDPLSSWRIHTPGTIPCLI